MEFSFDTLLIILAGMTVYGLLVYWLDGRRTKREEAVREARKKAARDQYRDHSYLGSPYITETPRRNKYQGEARPDEGIDLLDVAAGALIADALSSPSADSDDNKNWHSGGGGFSGGGASGGWDDSSSDSSDSGPSDSGGGFDDGGSDSGGSSGD